MIRNEEEMVRCPYNMAHIIMKHRMAAHLIKCRVQHPSSGFAICPFNSTHDVPKPELQYHIENCEDSKKLDSFIYVTDYKKPRDESDFHVELPPMTENWDEESRTAGSYLDIKNKVVENKPVFRLPVGMSKAERKAFFRNEVERFGNVSGEKPLTSSSGNTSNLHSGSAKNSVKSSTDGASCKREQSSSQNNHLREFKEEKGVKALGESSEDDDFQVVVRHKSRGRGLRIN